MFKDRICHESMLQCTGLLNLNYTTFSACLCMLISVCLHAHAAKGLSCALSSQDHRSHPNTSVLGHLVPVITSLKSIFVFRPCSATKASATQNILGLYNRGQCCAKKKGLFTTQPLPSTLKHRHRQASNPA